MFPVQEQVLRREAEDFKTQKEASMPCFRMSPLGRPLGYLIFSLMAVIRDPIYTNTFSKGFGGQPSPTQRCKIGFPHMERYGPLQEQANPNTCPEILKSSLCGLPKKDP